MSSLELSPENTSHAVPRGPAIAPTDGELLVRFTRRGDTAAFAELVDAHAPLVLSVCRQVLRRSADVDDAFQATFLILAKRAGDIRASDSAAGWLYRVAYRTSVALARQNKSRPEEPLNGHDFALPECDPLDRIHQQHSVAVLIEELRALPARYQEPLVLCYLEGHSRSRAAEMLDSTTATIKGRLARGKQLLRHRLARRGVALSIAAGIATSMIESATAAGSSATLATETAHAASQFVASSAAASSASPIACSLAQQGVSAMLYASLAKPMLAGITVLALGVGTLLATDAEPARTTMPRGVTLNATADRAASGEEAPPVAIQAPPLHREQAVVEHAAEEAPETLPASNTPRGENWARLAPEAQVPEVNPSQTTPQDNRYELPIAASKPQYPAPHVSVPPVASTYQAIPTMVPSYQPVRAPLPADFAQPGVEELELELDYWEIRAKGLEQKSAAMLKRFERLQRNKSKSSEEEEDISIGLADAIMMQAEVYQAKGKALEVKRKIAAREQQSQWPQPIGAAPQTAIFTATPPQPAISPPLYPMPYTDPYRPATAPTTMPAPQHPVPYTNPPRPTTPGPYATPVPLQARRAEPATLGVGPTYREADSEERSVVVERSEPSPQLGEPTIFYRWDNVLRPGDEVTIEFQWKSGRHGQIVRECLSESGTIRIPYAQGSIALAGPLGEAAEKLKVALGETFGESFSNVINDVIVKPTGRRIVFVPSSGNASFSPSTSSPLQPQAQIVEPLLPGVAATRNIEPGERGVLSEADPVPDSLRWQTDIDAAVHIAQQTRRKIVVHFFAGNANSPQFEESLEFYEMCADSPSIRRYLDRNTVPVVINVEANPMVAERFNVKRVPAVYILNTDGTLLEKFAAPKDAKGYLTRLTTAVTNPPNPMPTATAPAIQPSTPWLTNSSSPTRWPATEVPPHPPIDLNEVVKLKQELEALRSEYRRLQERVDLPHPNDALPQGPPARLDPLPEDSAAD